MNPKILGYPNISGTGKATNVEAVNERVGLNINIPVYNTVLGRPIHTERIDLAISSFYQLGLVK